MKTHHQLTQEERYTTTAEGRAEKLGTFLACMKCDACAPRDFV